MRKISYDVGARRVVITQQLCDFSVEKIIYKKKTEFSWKFSIQFDSVIII